MRLAILGATGGIGGYLLSWALEAGHEVHVLARAPVAVPPAAGLTVTQGDALDTGAVAEVITGADAVLSALGPRRPAGGRRPGPAGPRGAGPPSLLGGAASGITEAMAKTGARRLICVSAAGAYVTADPHANPLIKLILPRVFAGTFADVRRMEEVIRGSGLDWTLVRATRLTNGPRTGRYRVSPTYPPRGGGKISRADVADLMTAALTEGGWIGAAPSVAY